MLTDEQLDALKAKHRKIGTVDFDGHQIVFRVPTRDEVKEFKRKDDSPSEKYDRVDQLAQQMLIAFDSEQDIIKARMAFLSFLVEYPMFCDSPRCQTVIMVLAGGQEAQHAQLLGKGCDVLSATKTHSQTASVAG